MESIIGSQQGVCAGCGAVGYTEEHHVYYGTGRRKISDRNGFIVYLCPECHRGTYGVHGKRGKEFNLALKRRCQAKYEEEHSRKEFIDLIGKSYI